MLLRRLDDAAATRQTTAPGRGATALKTLLAGAFCLALSGTATLAAVKAPLPEPKPGPARVVLPEVKPAVDPVRTEKKATAAKAAAKPAVQTVAAVAQAPLKPQKAVLQNRGERWTCVKYVQAVGSVALRGDGWQWWDNAAGIYDRGQAPKPGAVLVLKRTSHLRSGHVAIVSKVLDKRTILVDHANWGWSRDTKGKVHLGMKVVDVSPKNDWSQTRFWFEPGDTLGSRTYPAYGFVYAPRASRPGPGLPQTRGVRG